MDNGKYKDKTLVVIGAGFYQRSIIQTAKSLGLYVLVIDYNPSALGASVADRQILHSAHDAEGSFREIEAIRNEIPTLSGVLSGGTRRCMSTTAYLAMKFSLPGVDYKLARQISA